MDVFISHASGDSDSSMHEIVAALQRLSFERLREARADVRRQLDAELLLWVSPEHAHWTSAPDAQLLRWLSAPEHAHWTSAPDEDAQLLRWFSAPEYPCSISPIEATARPQFRDVLVAVLRLLTQLLRLRLYRARKLVSRKALLLLELWWFRYHGFGRPPRSTNRVVVTGLSVTTGRMCSRPVPA